MKKSKSAKVSVRSLEFFYAVTMNSAWKVVIGNERWTPYILKIAENEESNQLVGTCLGNGKLLSIGNQLVLFEPEVGTHMSPKYEKEVAKVDASLYWGGVTSRVVALFLDEAMALDCLKTQCLEVCAQRWKENTKEVLRLIGLNHPKCSISLLPGTWLMPLKEWQK